MSRDLLFDLDGVFVDFVRGSLRVHNYHMDYDKVMWTFDREIYEDPEKFWAPFGYEFWANLEWLPEGKELLEQAVAVAGWDNIILCTSPAKNPGCIDGKIAWIEKNIPQLKRQFMITPAKQFAASRDKLLIDDNDGNVKKFQEAGGKAVLVPAPWNENRHMLDPHNNWRYPVKYVMAHILSFLEA